ncbi:Dehydrogenase/reductase SDR family member on chromosome X-like [Homarus americanus]|uniref:Dehydrogenase/reductase SDR family member on chromosome X-like n=1 Tax=Homarus americanus TaxID=6706 RepID=A0A8J5NBJ9_HOMAM|nr:Dehydrogenase/reductase SDR family member on chromosome X-like [Homarus americanus]
MTMDSVGKYLWIVWSYLKLYALGLWYLVKELCTPHKKPSGIESQNGRVAIVTGGGRGIGLETVRRFLELNMTVVIAGRNVAALEEAVSELRAEGIQGGTTKCLELDLMRLSSVRKFVEEFFALNFPLHLLVNNAGIMFWPKEITEDGHESHWSVNYLGHFLLTHLLFPSLVANSTPERPARVVNLSSSAHYIGSINFDDINSNKLAQLMFTMTLADHQRSSGGNVVVNAVHPGVVATQLFQHVAWARIFPLLATTFLKTPHQGSDTVVHVALSSQAMEGGYYYENCTITKPATAAMNSDDRACLWVLSCKQLEIEHFGQI